MDRKAIKNVVCDDCGLEQLASRACIGCGVTFAYYYCAICHLWDDDQGKGVSIDLSLSDSVFQIWHCNECGLCRRGGQDNYVHCVSCNACYPKSHLDDTHKGSTRCYPNALKDKCTICLEDMFSSTRPVTVLQNCGHAIHVDCLERMMTSRHGRLCCTVCSTPFEPATSSDTTNTS